MPELNFQMSSCSLDSSAEANFRDDVHMLYTTLHDNLTNKDMIETTEGKDILSEFKALRECFFDEMKKLSIHLLLSAFVNNNLSHDLDPFRKIELVSDPKKISAVGFFEKKDRTAEEFCALMYGSRFYLCYFHQVRYYYSFIKLLNYV